MKGLKIPMLTSDPVTQVIRLLVALPAFIYVESVGYVAKDAVEKGMSVPLPTEVFIVRGDVVRFRSQSKVPASQRYPTFLKLISGNEAPVTPLPVGSVHLFAFVSAAVESKYMLMM